MVNPTFNLFNLNGSNGFTINGIAANTLSGYSVSNAGDVNGDGIDDLIISAPLTTANGNEGAGQSYVVFGTRTGFSSVFNLSTLNGSNGFAINGIAANDFSGYSVNSAGDVNGDGIDDLIVGAYNAAANGNQEAGQSYVVFGTKAGFPSAFNLSTLNGSNGFILNGIAVKDLSSYSAGSAGDVNGDGIDDLIVGAPGATAGGNSNAGQSYIVFGTKAGFPSALNLSSLNGSNGFTINGIAEKDALGYSASGAGDVNGDGIDDLIIGARNAAANGKERAGQSYVVFGTKAGFPSVLNPSSLNGTNGFTLNGIAENDASGYSVSSAGDVNGDGIDDLFIGTPIAFANGNSVAGQSYVVFGTKAGFPSILNLSTLNGSNGFTLNGIATSDESGTSISSGDINGDGIDDLIIGAPAADPNGSIGAGQTYVVFGSEKGFPASLNLFTLDGNNGFILNGIEANSSSGLSVSTAGDVNGDGVDDLVIGARNASVNSSTRAGQTYVVFGTATPIAGLTLTAPTVDAAKVTLGSITADLTTGSLFINKTSRPIRRQIAGFKNVNGTALADVITGNAANNTLVGNAGNDSISGSAGKDLISGGAGKDTLTGGTGKDQFVFDIGTRFKRKTVGIDTITDFSAKQDKIVLDRTTFKTLTGKVSFDSVLNVSEAKGSAAQIVYIRKTGGIYYNSNGDSTGFGIGGQFADVANGLNLTAKNFSSKA